MQRSTIAIIADVALVETQTKGGRSAAVLTCNISFAPTDRVTAESDSQRLARSAELSCDYKNKDSTLCQRPEFRSCSLLFL